MPAKEKAGKSLAEQIAELEDPTPKDLDPEDQYGRGQSSEDESELDDDASAAGREHYEAVGKSKLRKPEPVELGREYMGSRISRDDLYGDEIDEEAFQSQSSDASGDSNVDQNEAGSEEEEVDSDGSLGNDIGPSSSTMSKRNTLNALEGADVDMDDYSSDGESEIDDTGEEEEGQASTEESEIEDESEDERSKKESGRPASDDRDELRRLMASDQRAVAASISQASKADAAKGLAVKRQRAAFDALLNTRIKLQKGLSAASELSNPSGHATDLDADVVKAAEAAALTLWDTIDDLRYVLADAQSTRTPSTSSKKRKRSAAPTSETTSSEMWAQMREFETGCFNNRRAVLDKWARKTRSSKAVTPNSRGKLLNTGGDQQSLSAVLDAHAAAESEAYRSSSRRDIPESKSKESNNNLDVGAAALYDDTAFYNSLLRDLVEQRMSSANGRGIADNLYLQIPTRLSINPVSGMRKDKVKRAVDTKASKGRKMRFTVQEKLQNFMVPEERGTWSDRAREEFFASLLGQSANVVLGEDEEDEAALENGDEAAEDEDLEEGGLRLFRS